MTKLVRGKELTDEEVENLGSGRWDDEIVVVVCEADGWEKFGRVSDLKNDFDVDFYDMDQKFKVAYDPTDKFRQEGFFKLSTEKEN